ncbi:hypothetical protein KXR87_17170 [Yokenella regensburgei]|uniref:hypothetical protein n=1 Tax=Yokenella regensburgei TaxID=158877 RepID=UPI003F16B08D
MKTTTRLTDMLICEATAQLLESQSKITYANLIRQLRDERMMTDDNDQRLHYTLAIGQVRAHELLYKNYLVQPEITSMSS